MHKYFINNINKINRVSICKKVNIAPKSLMTISNLANFEMLLLTFLIQNIKEKAKGVLMASLQAKVLEEKIHVR